MSCRTRNKKYRPREIHQPMMAATRDSLALELRLAAEALILAPSIDSYNQLSLMMAALTTAGFVSTSLDKATAALTAICDRFDRLQKVGISGDEAENLRAAVASLDSELPQIPINRFRAAVALTQQSFAGMRHSQERGGV